MKRIKSAFHLGKQFSMFGGEGIDLLKMDCEVCEYKLLNSLDANEYRRIEGMYLEYHYGVQNLQETLEKMVLAVIS